MEALPDGGGKTGKVKVDSREGERERGMGRRGTLLVPGIDRMI